MTDASYTLSRAVEREVVPRDQVPAALRAKALRLDVDDCSVFAVYMRIGEFEKAGGLRFDQWPEAIRARMEKEIAEWKEREPSATLKAVTQAIEDGVCILALHYRIKA